MGLFLNSILSHQSVSVFMPNHAILITMSLQYILKFWITGVMPLAVESSYMVLTQILGVFFF